jgi:hypothetical protein
VAPDPTLGTKLYDEELAKNIERVAQLGELLGLTPEELATRVRGEARKAAREATNRQNDNRMTKEYS